MVEQWPFKPFVTGSNPVRPNKLYCLIFSMVCLTTNYSVLASSQSVKIQRDDGITLNANLSKNLKNDSVYMIVHGTRGFKTMEIIRSLEQRILIEGHDVLSINLSYGISNRNDSFLSCDIEHTHSEHESVREIINCVRDL